MTINKTAIKAKLRVIAQALLNPSFLLCFGLAWMITNGWCYLFLLFGTLFSLSWMTIVGGAYASLLWLPFTPEKIITLSLSIVFLRWFFPNDQKTLKILHDEYTMLKGKLKTRLGRRKKSPDTAA